MWTRVDVSSTIQIISTPQLQIDFRWLNLWWLRLAFVLSDTLALVLFLLLFLLPFLFFLGSPGLIRIFSARIDLFSFSCPVNLTRRSLFRCVGVRHIVRYCSTFASSGSVGAIRVG